MKLLSWLLIIVLSTLFIIAVYNTYSGEDVLSIPKEIFEKLKPETPIFEVAESTVQNLTGTKPVEKVNFYLMTTAMTAVTGRLEIYGCEEDDEGIIKCGHPGSDQYQPIQTLPISHGKAVYEKPINVTHLVTNTPYSLYFDGGDRFYDKFLSSDAEEIFEYKSDSAIYEKIFEVEGVGTILDPLNENNTINNQPSTDLNHVGVEIGCSGGCKDDDVLVYNKTNGDGAISIELKIGVSGYGSMCKDLVLYFDFPYIGKPEGNEFSSIKLMHIAGHELSAPSELVSYFKSRDRVYFGTMESGEVAIYQVSMSMKEYNIDKYDRFCIVVDDKYGDNDLFGNEKASEKKICFAFEE